MEKRDLKVIFCSKDLRLVPETREVMEHFKLVFGSGTSSPAKIRPLKVWDLLDFPLGSALWNFASPKGGGGVETERSGAEVPVRWEILRERERKKVPRCWTIQSQAERRDRGQTEESWVLVGEK